MPTSSQLKVDLWTEEQFASARADWQALLDRSDASPMFMSWEWQWTWWKHLREELQGALHLFAVSAPDGQLLALAPFYRRVVRHAPGVRASRLEIIGSTYRTPNPVFSEHLDIVADRERVDDVVEAVARHLSRAKWSDLVTGYAASTSVVGRVVQRLREGHYLRETDRLEGHVISLPDSFDTYLKSLSGNARRRIWNQRSKLTPLTEKCSNELSGFLDSMDRFHLQRWGHAHFTGVRRRFHLDFMSAMAERNVLRLSELSVGNNVLSLLYDLRFGNTVINLQAGFDATQAAGVSPGYLHFGYGVENACTEKAKLYDFLAGEGQHRQYKQDFGTTAYLLQTYHLVRSKPLALIYRIHDAMKAARHFLRRTKDQ